MTTRRFLSVLAPLALLIALVSWAFASPIGASPDDDYHLPSIWCGQGIREGLCEPGDSEAARTVPAALTKASACFAFNPAQSAACALPDSSVMVSTTRGNFVGDYPPVFYSTMSIFAGPDIGLSTLLMRAFNALLFVGISVALFFLLPTHRRSSLAVGAAISLVPLGCSSFRA